MSIIYDALQKTQRNREYFRVQNALTQKLPHRRNLKWMVMGSLILVMGVGVGGIFSFYALTRHAAPNLRAATQPASQPAVQDVTQGGHLWVTDTRKMVVQPSAPQSLVMPVVVSAPAPAPISAPVAAPSPEEDPVLAAAPQRAPAAAPAPTSLAVAPQPQSPAPEAPQPQQAAPVASTTILASNLTLNGVLISSSESVALINNQPFRKGDVVDGMKILDIDANSVKLQNGPQVIELRVSA